MAIKNEFFETENNKKAQSQNTMDNSGGMRYNKNITDAFLAKKEPFESSFVSWYDKNKGALKYAGDSTKESVEKGLSEAPTYMKDAEPGTNFTDVQTASVKRSLAKDANDKGLYNSAVMEMIGLLSTENKDPYLSQSQPLQTYIDAKDKFDFLRNNYTTTKNIDQTPDENVRQLQRGLNAEGYTDKMGQPLKEDGVFGGKTAYALDTSRANISKIGSIPSVVKGNGLDIKYPITSIEDLQLQVFKNAQVKKTSNNNAKPASSKPESLKFIPDIIYDAWNKAEDSIWKIGAKVLDLYGWHLSSELLYLAASGSDNKYVATEGSYASNLLKNDKGLNKFINDVIWEYGTSKGNKNPDIPQVSYNIPLSNGDLGAALHKVDLNIEAKQNPDGTWTATIKATDNFNFSEIENPLKYKKLKEKILWLANDIAVIDTNWGLLDNVPIEITFKNNY